MKLGTLIRRHPGAVFPAVALSLALPAFGWQGDLRPQFDKIRLGTDAEVSFDAQPGIEDPDAAAAILKEPLLAPRSTTDGKYTLYFLPSRVQAQNAGSYISYDFYVAAKAQPEKYIRYRLNATSVGSFVDTRKETTFHLGNSEGQIEIPIFCPSGPALIEVAQAGSLNKVAIAGEPKDVTIKNLSGLGLLVRIAKAEGSGVSVRQLDTKRQYAINSSATKQLSLEIKPSVFEALTATYAPASLTAPHGHLKLTLECEFSDTKSVDIEPITITLPLEYAPSFWHLGGVVAMGGLVGWVFCSLVSLITGFKKTIGTITLLARLAVAVLLGWILDATSALTDSRLVLFGLDVNPTRLPPAFILGVICGVIGAWYLDRLIEWIEKKMSQPREAAAAAGAGH